MQWWGRGLNQELGNRWVTGSDSRPLVRKTWCTHGFRRASALVLTGNEWICRKQFSTGRYLHAPSLKKSYSPFCLRHRREEIKKTRPAHVQAIFPGGVQGGSSRSRSLWRSEGLPGFFNSEGRNAMQSPSRTQITSRRGPGKLEAAKSSHQFPHSTFEKKYGETVEIGNQGTSGGSV